MENSVIDLMIRIKNGYLARNETVESPFSQFRVAVLKKLVSLHFVKSYSVTGEVIKTISVELLYTDGVPDLTDVELFSKPGRKMYVTHNQLKSVMSGFGYAILSTSKGILTNIEAKKEKIGGELLFNVW